MKAEIICIGTELLLGHIVNTNASFIARKLAELGIDHYFQTNVGDNPQRLADTIKTGLSRSDIVITTGGLGPTVDDITTQTIANLLNKKLILEKGVLRDINEFFKKINREAPKDALRQALIPEGAKWLKNPFGTAPGLIIEHGSKVIIALPGPPREMNPMVEHYVIPCLKERIKRQRLRVKAIIKSRSIKLIGLAEAKVNEKVKDLLRLSGAVTVGIYARQGEVELKIMAKARDEKSVDLEMGGIEKIIRKRLGIYIYGVDKETLEEVVVSRLIKCKKMIATAESCTGGLIASLLTNVPGASKIFTEGIVAYSDNAKIKNLGIKAETLKRHGAVSAHIARQMAAAIRKKAGADIGIAVTGIAGPGGGTKTKPVGLVYIALVWRVQGTRPTSAVGGRLRALCRQFNFLGTRIEIKHQAAQAALDMVRQINYAHLYRH